MHVLVTGAAGRVGANVVRRLSSENIAVRALVMPGDPNAAKVADLPGVEVFTADLRSQSDLNRACRGITHVMHLAAQLVRGTTSVEDFWSINALGTLRLLEGVVADGGQLERFVLASSDGTYRPGSPADVPLREDSLQEPADYYGTSKLLGEVILRNQAAQYDTPYSIVRFGTVVSPEEADGLFRVGFLRAILRYQREGRDSHLWPLFRDQPDLLEFLEQRFPGLPDSDAADLVGPDGKPWTLHMLDVRDAVSGVYQALMHPGATNHAFNIAAPEVVSWRDGSALIAQKFGVERHSIQMPMDWNLELDITAARTLIDFAPRFDFVDTLSGGEGTDFVPAHSASGVATMR